MNSIFVLESDVRGFHVYRVAWNPVLGVELTALREPSHSEDPFAVRLKRGRETVGHVPREISKICWLFIHRGSLNEYNTVQNGGHPFRISHACARSGHFNRNNSCF